jgi:hypothetical protein
MTLKRFVVPVCLLSLLAVPRGALAQVERDSARSSIGLRVGYSWPMGNWGKSPVAPSVDLIGGNLAFEGDLDFAVASLWTLGIEGGYSSLNGTAWEEYASGLGDRITVSGSFLHFAVLIRPHIKIARSYWIRLEAGPALLLASGQETFAGRTYPYDFLRGTNFGVQAGLEYVRVLDESFALSIKASCLFFPSSIQYIGGATNSMLFVPISAGIRFLL